jgi:hypothetical protein
MEVVKTFRVSLSVGGVVFVEADRFDLSEGFVRFYRDDSIIAEYPATLVREEITEKVLTERVPSYVPPSNVSAAFKAKADEGFQHGEAKG